MTLFGPAISYRWFYSPRDYWKRPWYHLGQTPSLWYENLKEIVYWWPKAFIQRGWRGYADEDIGGMHSYLLDIIPPMLRRMRDKSHSNPCFNFGSEHCIAGGVCACEHQWRAELTTMLDGFEAANRLSGLDYDMDGKTWQAEKKRDAAKFERMMMLFTQRFFNLWT